MNRLLLNIFSLDLHRILEEKLKHQIPVIAVVSIMGTTEESAVDPLTDILRMRKKFAKKVSENVIRESIVLIVWDSHGMFKIQTGEKADRSPVGSS